MVLLNQGKLHLLPDCHTRKIFCQIDSNAISSIDLSNLLLETTNLVYLPEWTFDRNVCKCISVNNQNTARCKANNNLIKFNKNLIKIKLNYC